MEAKDTMLTQYQKDSALKLYLKEHPQYKGLNLWKLVARHQAEITWDIAFKAGIEEAIRILRVIGADRAADDVVLYRGLDAKKEAREHPSPSSV